MYGLQTQKAKSFTRMRFLIPAKSSDNLNFWLKFQKPAFGGLRAMINAFEAGRYSRRFKKVDEK